MLPVRGTVPNYIYLCTFYSLVARTIGPQYTVHFIRVRNKKSKDPPRQLLCL